MFTIYDLMDVMGNHCHDIVVQNDERLEDMSYKPFKGSVDEFTESDLFDRIQDEEVTDMYAEADGTIWICYCDAEEE